VATRLTWPVALMGSLTGGYSRLQVSALIQPQGNSTITTSLHTATGQDAPVGSSRSSLVGALALSSPASGPIVTLLSLGDAMLSLLQYTEWLKSLSFCELAIGLVATVYVIALLLALRY
jgi:hypothetical protein